MLVIFPTSKLLIVHPTSCLDLHFIDIAGKSHWVENHRMEVPYNCNALYHHH